MDLDASSIPSCGPQVLPLLFGVVLANTEDADEVEKLHTPPWQVVSMSGKGFGAVAEKDLQLGEMLTAERPLCIWPSKLDEKEAKELFEELGEREQQVYMDLAPVVAKDVKLDEIRSRRAANGFSIALPPVPGYSESQTVAMVFPKISRINHSCIPNASQVMNFMTLRMEVFSITSIPAGTEVTIEYQPGMIAMTKSERQAALFESFGFDECLCRLCTSFPDDIAKSDERRREIKQLSENLEGASDREATFAKLERIRILLEEEGFQGLPAFADPGVSSAFRVYLGLRARARREQPQE
ncbi:SET domain-containing protein [Sporobolomyces salmoneus]|uniref:SET domain-containing protein n=1 Tax=Sporobolomyces salmoneus TaxID=183962 RepID=UPI00317FD2A4